MNGIFASSRLILPQMSASSGRTHAHPTNDYAFIHMSSTLVSTSTVWCVVYQIHAVLLAIRITTEIKPKRGKLETVDDDIMVMMESCVDWK